MTYRKVQIGMTEQHLEDMDYLQEQYGLPNKAAAVGRALDIAKVLAKHAEGRRGPGGEIRLIVQNPDGSQKEMLVIPKGL